LISGPSHKKVFTVRLKIGDVEEYMGTGHSIRKAQVSRLLNSLDVFPGFLENRFFFQHAAAAIALEKTKLRHPPCRVKPTVNPGEYPLIFQ
jgi:hypothetical protein